MQTLEIKPGNVVVIGGFDDIPDHQFQVEEVYEDLVTGTVLTGPLAGNHRKPDHHVNKRQSHAKPLEHFRLNYRFRAILKTFWDH